jgi:hypothetical protein
MKTILRLFMVSCSFAILMPGKAQQFAWAKSYELPHANETAALAASANGSVYVLGAINAPISLPYTGDVYVLKTSASGETIWQETISGSVNVGDIAAVADGIVITGQSSGPFIYQGQSFGPENYFMFVMHLNHDGFLVWLHTDINMFGGHTNIAVDDQNEIAVRTRGQYNLSDWILIFNADGNIIKSKQIAPDITMIVDMAYQNGWVYLNGGFHGMAPSVLVDTIEIHRPADKNVGFVLALDTELNAAWVATDTTYNNRDGKIVVNNNAIFSFIEVQRSPFIFLNHLKKFTLEGELLGETEVPMFTTSVTNYPDMAISPEYIAFYASNAFDFSSHKLMLFDHDLNLVVEKTVDGLSHLYSGQIAVHNSDFYISHVFSGDLDFSGDVSLAHTDEGRLPYIAHYVTDETAVSLETVNKSSASFRVFPNPSKQFVTIQLTESPLSTPTLSIKNIAGQTLLNKLISGLETQIDLNSYPPGIYYLQVGSPESGFSLKKLVKH